MSGGAAVVRLLEDLRFVIGAFFLIVGGVVGIKGLASPPTDGFMNVNLYSGLAMVLFAAVMILLAVANGRKPR